VLDRILQAVRLLGTACLALLLALMVAQVVLRYGFGFTPFVTEELARWAMIWMVFAGVVLAVREDSHIRIEALVLLLPERARRLWMLFLDLLSAFLFAVLAWQGLDMVAFAMGQRSDGMRIPLAYPYAVLPAAFALAAVMALVVVRRHLRR
jgi:TRAP-type C4-dicarboxylate transport system permease small subunit